MQIHQRPVSMSSYLTPNDLTNILTWAKIISKDRVWSKSDSKLSIKLVQEKKRIIQLNYLKQRDASRKN